MLRLSEMATKRDTPTAEELFGPFTGWSFSRGYPDHPRQQSAVAWHHDERTGVMVAFVFAMTTAGVTDLVKVSIEFVEDRDAAKRIASEMSTRSAQFHPLPDKGLTSREIRSATAHKGLLAEARRRLTEGDGVVIQMPMRGQFQRGDTHREEFYARLAVQYGELLRSPEGGARRRLGELHGVSDSTVKNWITEAKRLGMWATAGSGRAGGPTPRAIELAQEAMS